ncbi:MarR family winged helix-turn-helix transcriptional regulator [Loktanella sp. Alg231-35]|uniref:MarR family winged helix-turn-helix transcriptional regulator n=1 Tax=Loktanella sp. Alg231-35 TaxID=1922220 RepID=UPI000D55BDAB|nr:MarR family transcriptional regulator [Loktanella sp. Alg231-35]
MKQDFELQNFLPYMLNQAAEASGLAFQKHYKDRYGMLRTEWRVLFHLGRYGGLTAKEIGSRARVHKTKISRAVAALEAKRFLTRTEQPNDRRHETLSLTPAGHSAFEEICSAAQRFDDRIATRFTAHEVAVLRKCLAQIAGRGSAREDSSI